MPFYGTPHNFNARSTQGFDKKVSRYLRSTTIELPDLVRKISSSDFRVRPLDIILVDQKNYLLNNQAPPRILPGFRVDVHWDKPIYSPDTNGNSFDALGDRFYHLDYLEGELQRASGLSLYDVATLADIQHITLFRRPNRGAFVPLISKEGYLAILSAATILP